MAKQEPVHPDLVKIALNRVTGNRFEDFVQPFWSSLIGAQYVPLGGVRDGGADGFTNRGLYIESGQAVAYLQASVEVDYASKVRRTVRRLRDFGRDPRELTYITSRSIKHIDIEERKLSRELDVTVHLRDAAYIIAHINDEIGTRAAYDHYLSDATSFLKTVGAASTIVASAHVRTPAVYVFLEQELARRKGDTTLVDSVTDSLILWALEGTDPDSGLFMSESDILQKISQEIPATRNVVENRLNERLRMLASKRYPGGRQIRWHQRLNVFVLPYDTRNRIEEENRADEALIVDVLQSFYTRASERPNADLTEADVRTVAEVALRALQRTFEQEGLEFASFLEDESTGEYATVTDSIKYVLSERGIAGTLAINVGEAVYEVIRKVLYSSRPVERQYLGKLSRTYTLLFTLNTEPRLLEYFQSLTGELNLYVGTDLLVKALSERYVPAEDQMIRRTLQLAKSLGATLVLAEPVIEEVLGNLRAADYEFRNWFQEIENNVNDLMARNAEKIMIRAYFYARLNPELNPREKPTSWQGFVSQFCRWEDLHRTAAEDQLRLYLQMTFGLEHETKDELMTMVDADELDKLSARLRDEKQNEHLARNDALMALAVYARRRQRGEDKSTSEFGFETWWLTGESRILKHTKPLVVSNRGARYMMRPDFLLNFLTLAPGAIEARKTLGEVFPSLLGIRLAKRMRDNAYHQVLNKVREANGYEPARLAAAIADATNKLKGDFWKQYRVQLNQDSRGTGSVLVATSETGDFA